MDKAEYNARAACSGLGWTEEDIKSFVDWHKGEENRRASMLDAAIIDIAIQPLRVKYQNKDYPKDTTPATDDSFEERQYRGKRNRLIT